MKPVPGSPGLRRALHVPCEGTVSPGQKQRLDGAWSPARGGRPDRLPRGACSGPAGAPPRLLGATPAVHSSSG